MHRHPHVRAISPASRCGSPRTGLDRYQARAGQTSGNMPVTIARYAPFAATPASRTFQVVTAGHLITRPGAGLQPQPPLCTRAVRCDLKPIMDRLAARVAACHNRRGAQLEGDSRLMQKDQSRAFHKSMEKMPPRVCRQTAMHARHGRTNPQHRESGWHDLRVAILSLRSTYPAVINRLRDN